MSEILFVPKYKYKNFTLYISLLFSSFVTMNICPDLEKSNPSISNLSFLLVFYPENFIRHVSQLDVLVWFVKVDA